MIVECLGTGCGDDFVILGGDQLARRRYPGRVAPGFEFVAQQPTNREVTELAGGDFQQAIVRSDENEAFYGSLTRDVNGDSTAKTSSDDNNVRMIGMHAVKQNERI